MCLYLVAIGSVVLLLALRIMTICVKFKCSGVCLDADLMVVHGKEKNI